MVLEYLDFKIKGAKIIEWLDEKTKDAKKNFLFNPLKEVPDELGKKILAKFSKEFRIVEEGSSTIYEFRCTLCDFIGKNENSLRFHTTRKHKEK